MLAETAETNGITSLAARTLVKGTATRGAEEINEEIEAVGGQIRAARRRAFDQSARGERRDAVGFRRLGEQSSAENGRGLDQGKFVVLAD
ncbi:MAG: insulinase family protein [Chthoniobacterales bacterium]